MSKEASGIAFESADSVQGAIEVIGRMIAVIKDAIANEAWVRVGFDIEGQPKDASTMQFAVRMGKNERRIEKCYFLVWYQVGQVKEVRDKLAVLFAIAGVKYVVSGRAEGECLQHIGVSARLINLEDEYQYLPMMRVPNASLSLLHFIFFSRFLRKDDELQRFNWPRDNRPHVRARATQYALLDALVTARLHEAMTAYKLRVEAGLKKVD
jgi:hypothetical protein